MKRLALAAAAALAAVLALPAVPASAAGAITVRNVDTTAYPTVRLEVLVNGEAPRTTDFNLRENGQVIAGAKLQVRPLKQTSKPVGTVLVIDTSGSMRTQGAMDQAKAAARSFISAKAPNDWIAVASFASEALIRSDFTQDTAALLAAVDTLGAAGETALWDGIIAGARLFEKRPDLQPNLVLLSDGADTVSAGTEEQARVAISSNHAAVFAVGIASNEFDPAGLNGLVNGTGGTLLSSAKATDLGSLFGQVRQAIENQYEVVYTSTSGGGPLTLDLAVAGASTQVQTRAGTAGAVAAPKIVENSGGLFAGDTGKILILVLATLSAALLGFALLSIFGRGDQSLEGRLGNLGGSSPIRDGEHEPQELAESSFVRRAVAITSRMADRAGMLERVEGALEQANLPLRAPEALFFYGAGVVLVGLLMLLSAPSLPVGIIFLILVVLAPLMTLKILRKKRVQAFEAQLPDTLNLLSGTLRAGYSFLQGVEAVAQETTDPMARELRRVLTEARLGRPLEDALWDVAVRMKSTDFEWSVMAIRIQREVGGNLAELLQTVADTMIQRSRLRGEVKALTAEGRLSAVIMGLLPIGLGGFMFMASPEYISQLFESAMGWAMVVGSALLGVAGFAWLQKIIKIEV
jgi:tight adherence protein B